MKIMKAVIVITLVASSFVNGGSQKIAKTDLRKDPKPLGCENNSAQLGRVTASLQKVGSDGVIIAAARLGAGEGSRELNRRRLFNVNYYLMHYRRVDPARIVLAEGEKTGGYGRVDLYVGGVLVESLLADKGKDLCVTCCGDYSDFYPERVQRKNKQESEKSKVAVAEPTNCETNALYLDLAVGNILKASPNVTLIAIARLGIGETSRQFNRRRLFNVNFYLTKERRLDPKRILITEGEKINGYGRVDLYVGGVLVNSLIAKRGKDVCVPAAETIKTIIQSVHVVESFPTK